MTVEEIARVADILERHLAIADTQVRLLRTLTDEVSALNERVRALEVRSRVVPIELMRFGGA